MIVRQVELMHAAHSVMLRWINLTQARIFTEWYNAVEDAKSDTQHQSEMASKKDSAERLARLNLEFQRLTSEGARKDETVEWYHQNNKTLQEQVADLEEQNLLNWTRWTELRRTVDEQSDDLRAERDAVAAELADLTSKHDILQSDVNYLQTRLEAK